MSLKIAIPYQEIKEFCRRHRIRKLALFGSVVREDFTPDSDVDVLVEFEPGVRIGLMGFSRLQEELSELLNRPVDLNTPGCLSPHFRDAVLREAEVIYEKA